jgi:hypothetical protein
MISMNEIQILALACKSALLLDSYLTYPALILDSYQIANKFQFVERLVIFSKLNRGLLPDCSGPKFFREIPSLSAV